MSRPAHQRNLCDVSLQNVLLLLSHKPEAALVCIWIINNWAWSGLDVQTTDKTGNRTSSHGLRLQKKRFWMVSIFQLRTSTDTTRQQAEGDEMMVYKTAESLYFVMRVDWLWSVDCPFGNFSSFLVCGQEYRIISISELFVAFPYLLLNWKSIHSKPNRPGLACFWRFYTHYISVHVMKGT